MTVEPRKPIHPRASAARRAYAPSYGYPRRRALAAERARRQRRGAGCVVALGLVAALVVAGVAVVRGGVFTTWLEVSQTQSPVRHAIVNAAASQEGYQTTPQDTYCNKFTAYWGAGSNVDPNGQACAAGTTSEEWCSDFAAWAWQKGGVPVTYGAGSGDLSGAAISFYDWAVAHGTWHPASSGYLPQPGDVAVYGINDDASWAAHVAVVTGYQRFTHAPYAINGDGDVGGFSVVVALPDETRAAISGDEGLDGYASPLPA